MAENSFRLQFLSIWGEDLVRDVLGGVTANPQKLRELARLRFKQAAEVESAIAKLSQPNDISARQDYAFSLPRAIQEIIILECVMELNRFFKQNASDLN